MDLDWLIRNTKNCWRHRGSAAGFVKRLAWHYSHALPRQVKPREFDIAMRYPMPVGPIRMLVRSNKGSDAFIFSEVFDHQYYSLELDLVPQTVLDLGANAGFTAVYFAKVYPDARLACVEPIASNVRVLRRNLALNRVSAQVFEAAVSTTDGTVRMEVLQMDYGHRVTAAGACAPANSVEVPAISVPTLLARLGWDRVGLLKIDIEGYERELLANDCDWLKKVDAICIECHEGFSEVDLARIASLYDFSTPRRLHGIWLLTRASSAHALRDGGRVRVSAQRSDSPAGTKSTAH